MTTIIISEALDTIQLRIPVQFRRRGGHRVIMAPNGENISEILAFEGGGIDHTLIATLGKAFFWQRMLDEKKYDTPKELAENEGIEITKIYRIIRLTLLAPDIIETILNGRQPRTFNLQKVIRGFPISWSEQRKAFGFTSDALKIGKRHG